MNTSTFSEDVSIYSKYKKHEYVGTNTDMQESYPNVESKEHKSFDNTDNNIILSMS